ncbi:ABC transporter substrate-binding protein [Corticimicrobacter populi]|uniref:Peptide ABC transporter substrate-binding protein n=1 Tax=Corticimicrobacter populi TaxID=2175229 RepID=A0A2V1JTC3_9BURK|nr:ABC transporter substrate-binding protein [Corticimicrobacter populi]PWF21067.1 peptide ABC transporter substrate-binding protein [Corticimicrobacter populi]
MTISRSILHTTLLCAGLATALPGWAAPLVIAQPADIRSTNPGVNRDNSTDGVILNVIEGLVGYRADGTVAPLLAESVDISSDGLTYTFRLRPDVKFHNGSPVTSAEVLWSWNRYMDPATGWRCLGEFDGRNGLKVTEVSAPDASTFVMKTDQASALFLDTLARTDCGMTAILHPDSVAADGSWLTPVATGPYTFVDWKRGEYVTLRAFTDYRSPGTEKSDGYVGDKTPHAEEVRFLVVPDSSAAKAGLQSGAIDLAQVTFADYLELKDNPNLDVLIPGEATKHSLLLQTRDPVLQNQKLRQAIAASLDISQIVQAASEGVANQTNQSAVHQHSPFYSDTQRKGYSYDPALAQRLLQEAGYKGEKITIYANKRAHVPSYQVAIMAQAMMQAAGINAQIEVLEWATQLDRYNRGNYQISSFTYSSRLDPSLSYEQFAGDKDQQSRKVWENPEALELIEASMREFDPTKRQVLFDQLHEKMLDDVPLIILFNGATAWGQKKGLDHVTVWEGKPLLW